MNLHGVVSGAIGAINPFIPVVISKSSGYTTAPDGSQVPAYTTLSTTGQKQALSGSDIYRLNSLNVQGIVCKMYLNGNYEGVFRVLGKGGDLLTFGGQEYLVAAVLERWPDWCCVALTMQVA
ncbi:hypothetical protein GN109_05965 [Collimonas pratensis]|uniref:hypothetical protein n=1 Tax=Collimonas pratensis TaxID=279113 RepID=UPI00143DF210|nr:hypothetical protein [Collimonas pratensis]NKI68959.1 hypothetical protein [Collimonas pratensis]